MTFEPDSGDLGAFDQYLSELSGHDLFDDREQEREAAQRAQGDDLEAGELMGVTRERIRQLRNRAFEKLRRGRRGRPLRGCGLRDGGLSVQFAFLPSLSRRNF